MEFVGLTGFGVFWSVRFKVLGVRGLSLGLRGLGSSVLPSGLPPSIGVQGFRV